MIINPSLFLIGSFKINSDYYVSHKQIYFTQFLYFWLSGQLTYEADWKKSSCVHCWRVGIVHPFLSMNKAYHIVEKITYLKLILSEGTLGKWILWAPVSTSSMSFLALRAMDTALGAGQALELPSEFVRGFFRSLPSVLFKFKRWEEK